jgi:hypothetical protein
MRKYDFRIDLFREKRGTVRAFEINQLNRFNGKTGVLGKKYGKLRAQRPRA